jgi:hypothetical protein
LYSSQNGVCSSAVGGGNQVWQSVLRVRGFMGKHDGCLWGILGVCEGKDWRAEQRGGSGADDKRCCSQR